MDKEQFNKLPYEKQTELEKLALRAMYLELYVKEWESDKRAMLTLRPIYQNPYGDEFRYYTDNYSVIQMCGKHLFANLQFSGHVSTHGSSSFHIHYEDFYYSVDLERAKAMYNTLNWLERKMREAEEELFGNGYYKSFSNFATTALFASGSIGGAVRDENDQTRTVFGAGDFVDHIINIENGLVEKFAESEAVNA